LVGFFKPAKSFAKQITLMLFGASTFIWVSPFSTANIDLLTKVKNMGYDIIEIAVEDTSIIDWTLIKDIARDLDLKITISGAFGAERDISSTEPQYRELGKQYIIDCIKIAQNVGSPFLEDRFIRRLARHVLFRKSKKSRSVTGVWKH
jgi:sugar phosphate isomerase/epimerase